MGGGGSKTKNKSTVVNDFVSKSIAESIMNCNNQSSVSQRLDIRGNYNVVKNVNMKQAFSLSSQCFQDSKVMNNMVNEIANSVKQAAESQNIALLGALTKSTAEVDNYIYNSVKNEIKSSTIQNIVNATNAEQGIGITGNNNIVEDITMNQVVDMISKNAQSAINDTDISTRAKTAVDQSASAKQENPLDAITNMLGKVMDGVSSPFKMVIAIVGIIFVMIAWAIFGGHGSSSSGQIIYAPQPFPQPQPQSFQPQPFQPPPSAPPFQPPPQSFQPQPPPQSFQPQPPPQSFQPQPFQPPPSAPPFQPHPQSFQPQMQASA
jgi:hypothetical protein